MAPIAGSNATDFDFLIGKWTVDHRRLTSRLTGSTDWTEFTSTAEAWKILGGLGNFDEITVPLPEGDFVGCTLRLFNPATRQWTIHWADSRRGVLDPPMTGGFKDGQGLFFGDDTHNGRIVRVRFVWTQPTPATCRWEQAFSVDGEQTWETNWTMDFRAR